MPLFIGPIFADYGVAGVLTLMGASLIIMIAAVGLLGNEPKRQLLPA